MNGSVSVERTRRAARLPEVDAVAVQTLASLLA